VGIGVAGGKAAIIGADGLLRTLDFVFFCIYNVEIVGKDRIGLHGPYLFSLLEEMFGGGFPLFDLCEIDLITLFDNAVIAANGVHEEVVALKLSIHTPTGIFIVFNSKKAALIWRGRKFF